MLKQDTQRWQGITAESTAYRASRGSLFALLQNTLLVIAHRHMIFNLIRVGQGLSH
jgi:hypothetical protein